MSAVIGSTVSLPCNLSPPSPDDSFSLVLWYRLDLPNPIYTLDARGATSSDGATHFASKVCLINTISGFLYIKDIKIVNKFIRYRCPKNNQIHFNVLKFDNTYAM